MDSPIFLKQCWLALHGRDIPRSRMGSPMRIGDEGWDTVDHVPHKVKLTEDYYAGVFELTIGQLKAADAFDKLVEVAAG